MGLGILALLTLYSDTNACVKQSVSELSALYLYRVTVESGSPDELYVNIGSHGAPEFLRENDPRTRRSHQNPFGMISRTLAP